MVKLKKLKEKTMSCTAIFAGEPVNFEYKPGALRDGTGYHKLMAEGVNNGNAGLIYDAVTKILVDWDLEVDVQELVDGGYYEPQYAPEDLNDDGTPVEGAVPVREAMDPPDADTIKLPIDRYALQAADIPGPLFGVLTEKMREDSVSGGKETKKGR